MADMSKQRVIEVIQLIIRRCGHLSQYVRVTADSALTKDNHTAGQNIGTFDSNRDRRTLIVAGQEVGRSEADTFTPAISMASIMARCPRWVQWYFTIADRTAGFSPSIIPVVISVAAASIR